MEQNKKVKRYILITSMNFPSGGAGATYLNLFCRGLKYNGIAIDVFLLKGYAFGNYTYTGPRKNISRDGIPYSYLGLKQRPHNKFLKLIDELFSITNLIILLFSFINKRKSINILVFNSEIQYNIPIHFLSRIFRLRVVKFVAEFIDKSEFSNTFFGNLKRYGFLFNFRYLNKLSDKLIVFSFYLKNKYVGIGYDENRIIVQPNLTDFDYWESAESKTKYTLGYSGAPYLKDGLYDLFNAISLLQKTNPEITLLIIGDAIFGKSLIPDLKLECARLGLSGKVTFTGLVESQQVKEYLSECKILTITRPSTVQTQAGFPTKLGEYFATRKPVLATNFGDMDIYFTDGQNIVMADCGDAESIAKKIAWMLENDKEVELISNKGYEKASNLLEYKRSINRIINFLDAN